MTKGRLLLLLVLITLGGAFFTLGLGHFFTLDYLKSQQVELSQYVSDNPVRSSAVFFGTYVLVTSLSLPGGAIMTLAGGAIFGLVWGTLLVSFASTLGATFALLIARYIFRKQVVKRFGRQIERIDEGIAREGGWYLFTLRLVPIFPFFLVNLGMAITNIRVPVFAFVSQIGMLAATIVYVNAGTQLAHINSLGDVLSFNLLASFTLLGVFPLIAKKLTDRVRAARALRSWDKPRRFDRDLVVIGAGSGGLVSALIAATVNSKVTLIEKYRMGGDCLNTGCVPSKTLIRSARLAADIRDAPRFGLKAMQPLFDFSDVMARVQNAIATIEPNDSVERYTSLGVDVRLGEAKVVSPWIVEVNGEQITTRNIIIATGATPVIPRIEGMDSLPVYTSENLWDLTTRPDRLVVLGGGPIGCELAQAFSRLGTNVTLLEALPRILPREDAEIANIVARAMEDDGVAIMTGHLAVRVVSEGDDRFVVARNEETGEEHRIACDGILVAAGRRANVTGFGLEELGLDLTDQGTLRVDEYLRTKYPNIYGVGDVAAPYQFTHTASHMAWYAAVNALFGSFWRFRVDYKVIPWCTYVSPEVAHVGVNESEAERLGLGFEVTRYDVAELDRAVTDSAATGMVKVITARGSDKILGVTIVAEHAGEVISEFVLAMKYGLGLGKILGTIHIYPTFAEMNKFAAGEWRKARKPEGLLKWVGRYHRWRRGEGLF